MSNNNLPFNRINALMNAHGQKQTSTKEEYDQRAAQMRLKTVQESSQKLHKHMMTEIDKLVPEWRKKLCKIVFPKWLNNALVIILRCLPPDPLVAWAMRGAYGSPHLAYRWAMLLPLVIVSSIIRVFIVTPLQFIQTRIWVYGITRTIRPLSEYENELTLSQRGGMTQVWKQDWRYGEMRKC